MHNSTFWLPVRTQMYNSTYWSLARAQIYYCTFWLQARAQKHNSTFWLLARAHMHNSTFGYRPEHKCTTLPYGYTVIRFLWVSAKYGTCTIVSVNGTQVEDKMRRFKGECAQFIFNRCPIYTLDGARPNLTLIYKKQITVYRREHKYTTLPFGYRRGH